MRKNVLRLLLKLMTVYLFAGWFFNVVAGPENLKINAKGYNNFPLGAYIYSKTLSKYKGNCYELVRKCSEIVITEVYLSFSNRKIALKKIEYTKTLNQLISLFHENDIKVYVLTYDMPTLLFNNSKLDLITENILEYNNSSPKNSRFDGVTADLEPHMLKEKSYWGKKTSLHWSKNGYQNNNLRLLDLTFTSLERIKKGLRELNFSETVPWFYLKHFKKLKDESNMSVSVLDKFLASSCDFIILMAYSSKLYKVLQYSDLALKSTNLDNSIMICIKTSIKTSGGGGKNTTFYGISREELIQNINKISSEGKTHKSFRGIAFFEFEGLLKIWETKN